MIFFPLTQKIIFITNTLFTIFYINTLHCFFFHISTYLQSLLNHLIPNFLRQLNHRIIIKLYRTYILFFRLRITFYLIYIPPADCPDIFKNIVDNFFSINYNFLVDFYCFLSIFRT